MIMQSFKSSISQRTNQTETRETFDFNQIVCFHILFEKLKTIAIQCCILITENEVITINTKNKANNNSCGYNIKLEDVLCLPMT